MSTQETTHADLFLLPTATAVRFALLIMVAGVGAMYLGVWYVGFLPLVFGVEISGLISSTCAAEAVDNVNAVSDQMLLERFLECLADEEKEIAFMLTATGPVWASLTLIFYSAYPLVLRYRFSRRSSHSDHRAVELAHKELRAALGDAAAQVRPLVTRRASGARVFGAFGRYWIAIDASLLTGWEASQSRAERCSAVIQHEAAHLRNRDVDISYLAMAAWWAFLVILAPAILSHVGLAITSTDFAAFVDYVDSVLLPLVALPPAVLLLQVARSRILRTREFYADVRAAGTDRTTLDGLVGILEAMKARTATSKPWWRRLRAYHPAPDARLRMIKGPEELARVEPIDLLLVGIALGVGQMHLAVAAQLLVQNNTMVGSTATAILLGGPAGAIAAAIVWNAVHAGPRVPDRLIRPAGALTAGIIVGNSTPHELAPQWGDLVLQHPGLALLSACALWVVCFVFLRWASLSASSWLSVTRRKRVLCITGLICAAVVFGTAFASWVVFDGLLGAEANRGWLAVWSASFPVSQSWFVFAAIGCASAFIFVSLVRGNRFHGLGYSSWVSIASGVGIALVYTVLLTLGGLAFDRGAVLATPEAADLILAIIVLVSLLIAAVMSFCLGIWLGKRNRWSAVLCSISVAVFTAGVLVPAAGNAADGISDCLARNISVPCWTATGWSTLEAYGGGGMMSLAVPSLLVACWTAALAGAGVRTFFRRREQPSIPNGPAALQRRWRDTVFIAVALLALVGVVVNTAVDSLDPGYVLSATERTALKSQVDPRTVSRAEACDHAATVFESPGVIGIQGKLPLGVVPLASSTDPVIAAFGTAWIEGAHVPPPRLIEAVNRYCQTINETERPQIPE